MIELAKKAEKASSEEEFNQIKNSIQNIKIKAHFNTRDEAILQSEADMAKISNKK